MAAWDDVAPYLAVVDERARAAGQPVINYFQVLTAMAFSAFADAPVDVAILEVGLGGTWDSTNVADGQVAVITPIAIDHQRLLGSTVETVRSRQTGIVLVMKTFNRVEQGESLGVVLEVDPKAHSTRQ